jgi:hypothetical protein
VAKRNNAKNKLEEGVEIYSTPLDIILVSDDPPHLPLGRPNLVLTVGRRSRLIRGFHLTFNPGGPDITELRSRRNGDSRV